MVQMAGKYVHEKNENFEEYLKGFGPLVTPEVIKKYLEDKPTLEVKLDGDKCSIISSSGNAQNFTFGQTFKDPVFGEHPVESTATLNGNKIEIKSVSKNSGKSGGRTFEFTDDGLIAHYIGEGVQAKRYYKRA